MSSWLPGTVLLLLSFYLVGNFLPCIFSCFQVFVSLVFCLPQAWKATNLSNEHLFKVHPAYTCSCKGKPCHYLPFNWVICTRRVAQIRTRLYPCDATQIHTKCCDRSFTICRNSLATMSRNASRRCATYCELGLINYSQNTNNCYGKNKHTRASKRLPFNIAQNSLYYQSKS